MLFSMLPQFLFDTDENAGGGAGGTEGANDTGNQGNNGQQSNSTQQNEGQNGANAPVIDWTKVDITAIPKDVIAKHPEHKKVVDETIQRRKEIKQLKKALTSDEDEGGDNTAARTSDTQQVDISKLSPAEQLLFNEVQKLTKRLEEQDQSSVWSKIKGEFNLQDDDREFIKGSTYDDMKKSAEKFTKRVQTNVVLESGDAGSGSIVTKNEAFKNRMKERMQGGNGLANPFDAGLHKQTGGTY